MPHPFSRVSLCQSEDAVLHCGGQSCSGPSGPLNESEHSMHHLLSILVSRMCPLIVGWQTLNKQKQSCLKNQENDGQMPLVFFSMLLSCAITYSRAFCCYHRCRHAASVGSLSKIVSIVSDEIEDESRAAACCFAWKCCMLLCRTICVS